MGLRAGKAPKKLARSGRMHRAPTMIMPKNGHSKKTKEGEMGQEQSKVRENGGSEKDHEGAATNRPQEKTNIAPLRIKP